MYRLYGPIAYIERTKQLSSKQLDGDCHLFTSVVVRNTTAPSPFNVRDGAIQAIHTRCLNTKSSPSIHLFSRDLHIRLFSLETERIQELVFLEHARLLFHSSLGYSIKYSYTPYGRPSSKPPLGHKIFIF